MKLRAQNCICIALQLSLWMSLSGCGAMIQIIDVDVKLPAEQPYRFNNREIAIFNAIYDSTGLERSMWNDSLLINKVAEGFRNQLSTDLFLDIDSIPVYNHFFCDATYDVLEDKEYIYALSEQIGARTLVFIDSLRPTDFELIRYRIGLPDRLVPILATTEWQMVFRFFDIDSDRFITRIAIKDTLFWNIITKDQDSLLVVNKLISSLPETALYLGSAAAKKMLPQWETQERVLFLYPGFLWNKAMEHAFMFEWEEALKIWLSISRSTKNPRKIAFAAYNLAVASEMMGYIDLAKEWLDLSRKYQNITEINHYARLLEERDQQRRKMLQ